MEQLLRKLEIDPRQSPEKVLALLEKKQMEYLDRLDSVEDESRRQKLQNELKEIESAISSLSWAVRKSKSGIARDEENFEDLKGQTEQTPQSTSMDGRFAEAQALRSAEKYNEAIPILEALSAEGYVKASEALGGIYMLDLNEPELCAKWEEVAANQGSDQAQRNLISIYSGAFDHPRDVVRMAKWLQVQADRGNDQAKAELGELYLEGDEGIPKDLEKAAALIQEAASQGNSLAQVDLALMYCNGEGVPADYTKAAQLFMEASKKGNSSAYLYLGIMYESGDGVEQDDGLALEYYEKALAGGIDQASEYIDKLKVKMAKPKFNKKASRLSV